MKPAQREAALGARDLIVIKLHRVDGAAAELVVLRVPPEDRAQQNAAWDPLGCFAKLPDEHRVEHWGEYYEAGGNIADTKFQFLFFIRFPPHAITSIVVV